MPTDQPTVMAGATPSHPLLDSGRYSTAAIVLHWLIALLILTQIGLGWYMNHFIPDHTPYQQSVEGLHISVGLTTLLLIVVRIVIRLVRTPPPMPADIQPWEKALAGFTHFLFYALMLAMPLTGWAIVSSGSHPISWWGLGWPKLPGVGFLAAPANKPLRHLLGDIHTDYLVWIALANLALHVAGALKHQFDGHPVLWRMIPGMKR